MSSQRNGTDTLSAMSFQVTCAYLLFYHSVFLYYIISLSPPLPFLPSYTPSCFLHSSSFPSFLDSFSTSLFHSFLPSSISSFFFFFPSLPTYSLHPEGDQESKYRLWAAAVFGYVFAAYFMQLLYAEYNNFSVRRLQYLVQARNVTYCTVPLVCMCDVTEHGI
jgi:hypothetical protein